MIQLAKNIFQAGQNTVWNCAALAKALECLENPFLGWHLVSRFVVANCCRRNGLQHRWREAFAKKMWKGLVGKASDVIWTMGRCALAHII